MASILRPRSRLAFEIALFCVLKVERDALETSLDEEYEKDGFSYGKAADDPNSYTTGRFGNHHIVLVYLPEMGNIGSTAAAAGIKRTFPEIKLALVVGICGVTPYTPGESKQEILLGDVMISTAVVKASAGRQYSDGLVLRTKTEEILGRAPVEIRAFLQRLQGASAFGRLEQKTAKYGMGILESLDAHGAYPGPSNDKLYPSDYRHKHQDLSVCEICARCQHSADEVCQAALQSPCEELSCDETLLLPRGRLRDARAERRQPSIWFGRFASAEFVLRSGSHRDRLTEGDSVIAFEMEGAGIWDYLPTILVKGASDYADSHKNKSWQQYSAIVAAGCAKAIVEEWRMVQEHNVPDRTPLSTCLKRKHLYDSDGYGQDVYCQIGKEPTKITESLRGIPHAVEAPFDSSALQYVSTCLENTRVALLAEIHEWSTARNSPPIFWLQGIAGTGKSTIAKTVARTLSEEKSLGASFFFSRGEGDRGNPERFFGSLVYQLCHSSVLQQGHMTQLRSIVHEAISATPEIFMKADAEQLKHLIMQPLLRLKQENPELQRKPVVIVVDAVDECDPVDRVGLILELLVQVRKLKTIPLRFFVTGRPEISINYRLRRLKDNVEHIILHNIESSLVDADISAFVQHEFHETRQRLHYSPNWPTQSEI
ncbi:nucleoside phosphorylase domain-containing protein [Aspergillus californicus]